jgi:hypothetical protein
MPPHQVCAAVGQIRTRAPQQTALGLITKPAGSVDVAESSKTVPFLQGLKENQYACLDTSQDMRAMSRDLILVIPNDRFLVGPPWQVSIMQPDPCPKGLLSRARDFLPFQPSSKGAHGYAEKLCSVGWAQFQAHKGEAKLRFGHHVRHRQIGRLFALRIRPTLLFTTLAISPNEALDRC